MTRHDNLLLDALSILDEHAWGERMAEALRPLPPLPDACPACHGRALGDDARPCVPCGGTGMVHHG